MLHRTMRSAALVLSVSGLLLTGATDPAAASDHRANDLSLRFDEIAEYARAASPRAQIIERKLTAARARRDEALQWSNPALAYDREEADDQHEWQLTLRKRIVKPFGRASLDRSWRNRIYAAELRNDQDTQDLLAELRSGYVGLQLLAGHGARLDRLTGLVDTVASVAGSRHMEGEMSGIEARLIRLSAYSVAAAGRGVRQEYELRAAAWRAGMGIPPGTALRLTTPVVFRSVDLDDASAYAALLADRPGARSLETLAQSLQYQADAARPDLLPAVDLYGGYKRFTPDLDGYVAGVALDIPFFGRNAGASRRLEAERMMVRYERDLDLSHSRREVAALTELIGDSQAALEESNARLGDDEALTGTLLMAYREGSLSLEGLLGAIQIETAALESHFQELTAYYRNIFRLEAITGAAIARLTP